MKKITKVQYNELCELIKDDTKAFNEKFEELLDVEVKPCTVYQYFYGDNYIGDSYYDELDILLIRLGVEIEQ